LQAQVPSSSDGTVANINLSSIDSGQKNITIQAVLCWSEYYNGKWQPTKTSDVNQPAELGQFNLIETNVFDRSKLLLWVMNEEPDNLRVIISEMGSSLFLLYNTHSVPLGMPLDLSAYIQPLCSSPFRHVWSENNSLSIWYVPSNPDCSDQVPLTTDNILSVLENTLAGRIIDPWNEPQDRWKIPFFYEDSRHVFLVRTTGTLKWVADSQDYGVVVIPGTKYAEAKIAPLILGAGLQKEAGPKFLGEGGPAGIGVVDPAPMRRFVTEDAYINKVICTTGVVAFDDQQIGPSGTIRNVPGMK
jgi:hypothetical protein